MEYFAGSYDVIVIGAGHAGIEACLAAARLGVKTAVFTINLDWVGNMPCNPSIGGTSKGHLVREIDALGGEMGKAADKYTLQSRMLNLGKGPAVHSLRAQIDRREYSQGMKHTLELQENLDIRQGEIVDLYRLENGEWQVKTKLEALFNAKAIIIATGTFLGGRVYIGDVSYESGPDGMFPATELSKALKRLNIPLRRFKTGTPSRVNRQSIDFSNLEEQDGDEETVPFSFETQTPPKNKVCCHITYSNEKTKQIILENLDRSPMYSGKIEGKGPRYCPSFEDKIVRFKDKERHQLFIEPCGLETEEMYLQGLSSSLPEDVQLAFIHTIPGLEHAQVMRTAYAGNENCCLLETPAPQPHIQPQPQPEPVNMFEEDESLKEQEAAARAAKKKKEEEEKKRKEEEKQRKLEEKKRREEERRNKPNWFKSTFDKLSNEIFSDEDMK